jgi:hypothetical protein
MRRKEGGADVKIAIGIALVILSPVLGRAGVAGDWAGVLTYPQQSLHIVLHVTGPDNALKATTDSPDQGGYGTPVRSITLTGSTLQFTIPYLDVRFSGDVNSNGTIVGTFAQRGTTVPLVLERAAAVPRVVAPLTQPAGVLENGHYHHNLTGVEFDVPYGWSVGMPGPRDGDPRDMIVLLDPNHRVVFASVAMDKVETHPENIPVALSRAVPSLIARRAGETAFGAPHLATNYKIREGSVEQTVIGGQRAVRAIADYDEGGRRIVELLTWIFTEHTKTYFFMKMPLENLPTLQMPFEQMLQSARIP